MTIDLSERPALGDEGTIICKAGQRWVYFPAVLGKPAEVWHFGSMGVDYAFNDYPIFTVGKTYVFSVGGKPEGRLLLKHVERRSVGDYLFEFKVIELRNTYYDQKP